LTRADPSKVLSRRTRCFPILCDRGPFQEDPRFFFIGLPSLLEMSTCCPTPPVFPFLRPPAQPFFGKLSRGTLLRCSSSYSGPLDRTCFPVLTLRNSPRSSPLFLSAAYPLCLSPPPARVPPSSLFCSHPHTFHTSPPIP